MSLRWPGLDAREVRFAGPDTRPAARWPGADDREVRFPPSPTPVFTLAADAVGGGVAAVAIVYVPVLAAVSVGAGVTAVAVAPVVSIAAAAVGGGTAAAVIVGAQIAADAVGGGVAAVTVLAAVSIAAASVGGGAASVSTAPAAVTTAAATGGGVAAVTVSVTPVVLAAATGGGTAAVTVKPVASIAAASTGGGTAAVTTAVGYRWSDTFNRADNASLGTDWRVDRNASPRIATNRAQMKTMSSGDGRAGCWVSWQGGGGTQAGRFATDKYGVKVRFIAPTGNAATDNFTGAILAVADTFGAGVMCHFVASTGNGCAIYTQSGSPPTSGISTGQTGQTQRAVTSTNAALTDLFDFRRERNVAGTADVFNLYRNGNYVTPFLTWEDIGAVVSSGATNRRWGWFCEGNYPIFNAEYRSPAVDSIEGYDL